jgi:hypothetical protein
VEVPLPSIVAIRGRQPSVVGRTVVAILMVAIYGVVPGADAAAGAGTSPDAVTSPSPPFPLDERLSFKVSWMGIHCGTMTLESFAEEGDNDTTFHIVMTASSSKFFDGVHRVRSRIESWFSGNRMSSVRYHYVSHEKKKNYDDLYLLDLDKGEVKRIKNGEDKSFAMDGDHVHDPLAYLYRLRVLAEEQGDNISLALVTTKGALETNARVVERRRIKTPFGKRDALRVVPEPKDSMLFSRSGKMTVWVGADDQHLPYRVVFDLSFGKLTAKLVEIGVREPTAVYPERAPPFEVPARIVSPCRTASPLPPGKTTEAQRHGEEFHLGSFSFFHENELGG